MTDLVVWLPDVEYRYWDPSSKLVSFTVRERAVLELGEIWERLGL